MNIEITRQIRFCAGHRLKDHGGKCENLHGHNYLLEVTVSSQQTDEVGRVMDFADIKDLFKGWIDNHWDHGFILWSEDQAAIEVIEAIQSKIYLMPSNPTAENMAAYIFTQVGPQLLQNAGHGHVRLTRVAIWETDQSYAVVNQDSPVETTTGRAAELAGGFSADRIT